MADEAASAESKALPKDVAATPDVDSVALDQAEIEALLNQAMTPASGPSGSAAPPAAAVESPATTPAATPAAAAPAAGSTSPQDVEFLLSQAQEALSSINDPPADLPAGAAPFELKPFSASSATTEAASVDLMRDVQLDLSIELGRTHMYMEDILKLRKGAVVPLDKLAGDPVDVYANGRLIARGEVLVLNDNFCVRVAELVESESS